MSCGHGGYQQKDSRGAAPVEKQRKAYPSKIRLLCVGRDLSGGGAERIQLSLLEHFDREKFDIQVFYLRQRGVLHGLIPQDISPVYGVRDDKSLKGRVIPLLARLAKLGLQSDVIFAMQGGTPIYVSALVGRVTRKPVVGWVHVNWSEALRNSSPWHRWAFRLHSLADNVIGVSEGVAEDLEELSPHLRGKVVALRNPLRLQHLRMQARATLPAWADRVFAKKTILAMGRLTYQKGFDILIPAFAKLVREGLDLHLLILGEGEERSRLQSMARELGISSRVFMPGFQENPYPFFERAEIFVLSSRYEGLGMVILEAMALGLPTIATDCPHGPQEIMQDGQYGVLVPPNEVAVLTGAMHELISSPERRAALSVAGAARAEEYDVERVTSSFEELLLGHVRGRKA